MIVIWKYEWGENPLFLEKKNQSIYIKVIRKFWVKKEIIIRGKKFMNIDVLDIKKMNMIS